MGLVDDLNRLSDLHASGQLSDAEFDEAKTKLIRDSTSIQRSDGDTAGGMATSTADVTYTSAPDAVAPPVSSIYPTTTVKTPGVGTAPGGMPGSYGARRVTTVITTGPFTGAVIGGPGAVAPTTRLKNRAQGLAAPSSVEPQRSAVGTFLRSLLWLSIPILFVALMVASAGVAIFPGLARIGAPILCKAPFDHSYVDITSSNPVPGETYIQWELQCYNDRGTVEAASQFSAMAIVFVATAALLCAITIVLVLLFRIRRGRKRRRAEQPLDGGFLSGGDMADMSGGPIVNPPA